MQQFKAQLLNTLALEKNVLQQITELENKLNFLLGRYPYLIQRTKDILFKALQQQISSVFLRNCWLTAPTLVKQNFKKYLQGLRRRIAVTAEI